MGVVDPDGRRADHGPRRRRRPRSCRRAWRPIQAVVLLVKDDDGAGERGRGASPTSWSAPGVRVRLDDRVGHELRPPGHRLGAEGRAGAGRGRSPRPGRRARSRSCGATPASKEQVPLAEAAGAGRAAARRTSRRDMLAAATGPPRRRAPPTSTTLDEAAEAAQTGFARLPWAARRGEGEAQLAGRGRHRPLPAAPRRHRCPGPTTRTTSSPSWPARTDDLTDAARIAGRAAVPRP